jgi:hypothetical protein
MGSAPSVRASEHSGVARKSFAAFFRKPAGVIEAYSTNPRLKLKP